MRYHYSLRLRTLLGDWEVHLHMPRTRTLRIWVKRRGAFCRCFRLGRWLGVSCSLPESSGRGSARADFSHGASLTYRGQIQVGSLTGAVHLSNDNAGVPRLALGDEKSSLEYKGLSWLDLDSQYEYGR